ncbi:hypothetical protein BGZ61DRAFT_473213 [Ilyonectria robusta]|uniref:uncharacterized protein n=1 Tax=Ilyonectria robusta TaxID=1079257 RepID=UPI001E8E1B9F|nr:uncharacterized protein BGZ61DRAFT_473213 [Ilyonectria robusta]KAH8734481.1 hypothetical protein BGZ61DRAFT_473213 [Ilyonectria robusta]
MALTVIRNSHEPPAVHSQPLPSPKRRPRLCPTTQLPRYTSAFHPDRTDRPIGPSRKARVGTLTGATITTGHTHLTHHTSQITNHTSQSPFTASQPSDYTALYRAALSHHATPVSGTASPARPKLPCPCPSFSCLPWPTCKLRDSNIPGSSTCCCVGDADPPLSMHLSPSSALPTPVTQSSILRH